MIAAPEGLVSWLAPWQRLYGDSRLVEITVTFLHLSAMLFGGGFAVATDRRTLRFDPRLGRSGEVLTELHEVHRPVVVALVVLLFSGVAMAAADVETFLASPIFALKLAIVAGLVANGGLLLLTSRSLARASEAGSWGPRRSALWRRLRVVSWVSLALWAAAVLAGTMLVNAA